MAEGNGLSQLIYGNRLKSIKAKVNSSLSPVPSTFLLQLWNHRIITTGKDHEDLVQSVLLHPLILSFLFFHDTFSPHHLLFHDQDRNPPMILDPSPNILQVFSPNSSICGVHLNDPEQLMHQNTSLGGELAAKIKL